MGISQKISANFKCGYRNQIFRPVFEFLLVTACKLSAKLQSTKLDLIQCKIELTLLTARISFTNHMGFHIS